MGEGTDRWEPGGSIRGQAARPRTRVSIAEDIAYGELVEHNLGCKVCHVRKGVSCEESTRLLNIYRAAKGEAET